MAHEKFLLQKSAHGNKAKAAPKKTLKELPIGDQSFAALVSAGCLYVDKTGEIYKLLKPRKRYFFSRPRRFGKSLTCSTLEAIFQNKRELFKGLAIDTLPYQWKKYAIVKFDFSRISYRTPEILEEGLLSNVNRIAKAYEVPLTEALLKERFADLIEALKKTHDNVAVIIDEYDKPLLDALPNIELAKKIQVVLRDFYSVFKAGDVDAAVDFLFITGVTKFAKASIFSAINNLQELSLEDDFAQLVGYTDAEVDHYFKDYIQLLADKEQQSYEQTREKIKAWYDGFQFSENMEIRVYNPFSLHNCLTKKRFSNYWFKSGTPTFLVEFISNNPDIAAVLPGLELERLSSSSLDAFIIDFYHKQYKSLFVQAGYLSIRSYDPANDLYTLAYPNEEVRKSMTDQIMEHVFNVTAEQFGDQVKRFRTAIAAYDVDKFCLLLADFYKLIPYVINNEKYYQNVFFIICKFLGFEVIVEDPTEIGRIDVVMRLPAKTIIIELKKKSTPDAALKQIEDREYCKKFQIEESKPIILVGMVFKWMKKGKKSTGVALQWKVKEKKTTV